MFDRNAFDSRLQTREIGRSFTHLDSCTSTNDVTLLLAQSGAPSGTLVLADHQTAGRGRSGSRWVDFPGQGLTFSFIVRDLSSRHVSLLSLVIGVSIVTALQSVQADIRLKWPNDLRISGRKVGGVLCESRWEGAQCQFTVVGIGLNVNENITDFPESLRPVVTSLALITEKTQPRESLLASLLNQIEADLDMLREGKTESLITRWMEACDHLQSLVEIEATPSSIKGKFLGVNSRGQARILTDRGETVVSTGTLTILEDSAGTEPLLI